MAERDIEAFSAASIAVGSKSFAAAARLFDARTRRSVIMLYAWCRHCDDVVDGQEAGSAERVPDTRSPQERIAALRRDTALAFEGSTQGLHPSFAALASVVREHDIQRSLCEEHLAGFEMDVEGRTYETLDDLMLYCWRVAGVVGVMMARIMGVSDAATLDRAADLGLAFQLTNIARDVVDDARAGRVYVPLQWLREEGLAPADLTDPAHAGGIARLRERLVIAADEYYFSARVGIDALPRRSAWAIGTAWGVYRTIGVKLVQRGEAAFGERISTRKSEKAAQMLEGARMALFRGGGADPRDPDLWTRPR
ncbi:phytoene/squalene synthase family protein [Aureimonas mangrovi]|uniref:phytoene/squalene synthase family protein n=1 Tax=Aureimonas mangrovi TaxID=2758041 RepID=UPI00163DD3BE|nr:phytoene/squalene synthase family protein [Aureimonas mangrovi]